MLSSVIWEQLSCNEPRHRTTAIIQTLFLVLPFILTVEQVPAAEKQNPPNIVLIVADDLGYSDLGCYGGEIETPHLDSLAKDGLRLTRFYNTGRCCPSRASLLTGQYPHRVGIGHKVADLGRPGYRGFISKESLTIAQVLKDQNYRSFISGKWHLGTPDPTTHGFDEFFGTLVSAQTFWNPHHYMRTPAGRQARRYEHNQFYGTDAVTDHAIDFLTLARETPKQPWFLYVAYHAPHFPLHARQQDIAKYEGKYTVGWDVIRDQRLKKMKELGIVSQNTKLTPRSRYWNYGETKTGTNPEWSSLSADRRTDLAQRMAIYAAMVDRVDQNIGRILNDLIKAGELENTVVLFLSDNGACAEWDPFGFDIKSSNNNILHKGEQLKQMGSPETYHSVGSAWANASNTPWRLQKHFNHEGGINSPCIIHWPAGNVRRGAIADQPTHLIDLMPTIVDAAGVNYTGKLKMVGESLIPLFQEETQWDRALFFEHEGNRAVHDKNWKLVSLRDKPWELYDMTTDRTELNNLATQHPDVVQKLSTQWNHWAKENYVTPLPKDYGVDYLRKVGVSK
jgi:arylsulfatase A-like enzyme